MHRVFLCVVFSLAVLLASGQEVQDWNLLLHKVEYNTSHPDLFQSNLRANRKEPGVYALNGSINFGIDVDDNFSFEVKIYRSPSGSGQYKITPYKLQAAKFCEFIPKYYIPMVQNDLEKCSNLPIFDKECKIHLKKGTYDLNMCLLTNGGMPAHIQPGYYKVVSELSTDEMTVFLSLYVEAEPKRMI